MSSSHCNMKFRVLVGFQSSHCSRTEGVIPLSADETLSSLFLKLSTVFSREILNVSYYDSDEDEVLCGSDCEFKEFMNVVRECTMIGKYTTLIVAAGNALPKISRRKMKKLKVKPFDINQPFSAKQKKQNALVPQVVENAVENEHSSILIPNNVEGLRDIGPPQWFIQYMEKFKEEFMCDLISAIRALMNPSGEDQISGNPQIPQNKKKNSECDMLSNIQDHNKQIESEHNYATSISCMKDQDKLEKTLNDEKVDLLKVNGRDDVLSAAHEHPEREKNTTEHENNVSEDDDFSVLSGEISVTDSDSESEQAEDFLVIPMPPCFDGLEMKTGTSCKKYFKKGSEDLPFMEQTESIPKILTASSDFIGLLPEKTDIQDKSTKDGQPWSQKFSDNSMDEYKNKCIETDLLGKKAAMDNKSSKNSNPDKNFSKRYVEDVKCSVRTDEGKNMEAQNQVQKQTTPSKNTVEYSGTDTSSIQLTSSTVLNSSNQKQPLFSSLNDGYDKTIRAETLNQENLQGTAFGFCQPTRLPAHQPSYSEYPHDNYFNAMPLYCGTFQTDPFTGVKRNTSDCNPNFGGYLSQDPRFYHPSIPQMIPFTKSYSKYQLPLHAHHPSGFPQQHIPEHSSPSTSVPVSQYGYVQYPGTAMVLNQMAMSGQPHIHHTTAPCGPHMVSTPLPQPISQLLNNSVRDSSVVSENMGAPQQNHKQSQQSSFYGEPVTILPEKLMQIASSAVTTACNIVGSLGKPGIDVSSSKSKTFNINPTGSDQWTAFYQQPHAVLSSNLKEQDVTNASASNQKPIPFNEFEQFGSSANSTQSVPSQDTHQLVKEGHPLCSVSNRGAKATKIKCRFKSKNRNAVF